MKTKSFVLAALALLPLFCVLAQSEPAHAALDAKCFTECNKTYKSCMASCGSNASCVSGCNHTFHQCSSGCNK